MKRLAKLLGFSDEEPQPARVGWPPSTIAEFLRQFPVGSRVLYYPELKRELRLDSIILGCTFNNKHFVYSPHDVITQKSGEDTCLHLANGDEPTPLTEIRSFHLLIPYQSRVEIDYRPDEGQEAQARFTQSTINDFERHNLITLISYSPYGRVPHLETTVRGTSTLTKGYYANQKVVVLDPVPHSLSFQDKRRHQRVHTDIPLTLRASAQGPVLACTLEDFSERFLRIRVTDGTETQEELAAGRRVVLKLDLEAQGRSFVLQGCVFRNTRGAVVVELQGILKDGRFADLHLVDELDLKASLLRHPETQRLQRRAPAS
jgi:hypothetical protein